MNIIANAIDAVESRNFNRSFAEIEANPNLIVITTELAEDKSCILITIKDNGVGMEPEIRDHIFDNLFTTKPVGKGTGLGLAISRQIVEEKHGGKLKCFSTIGEGSEFIIELPI
jgi:signal transduction histidine kinase